MKRYFFEAERVQLEKPTELRYVFCAPAQTDVYAEDEVEARLLAEEKLHSQYEGTGVRLGEMYLTDIASLPADWSYGYGDERKRGDTASIPDRVGRDRIV